MTRPEFSETKRENTSRIGSTEHFRFETLWPELGVFQGIERDKDRKRSPERRGRPKEPSTWRLKENDGDATRTLFVGNMPADIREAEIRRVRTSLNNLIGNFRLLKNSAKSKTLILRHRRTQTPPTLSSCSKFTPAFQLTFSFLDIRAGGGREARCT